MNISERLIDFKSIAKDRNKTMKERK